MCETGDYFGILLDAPATGFPYNIMSDPMYNGTTLNFLGEAIRYVASPLVTSVVMCGCRQASPAGLFLTAVTYIVFQVAEQYEGYVVLAKDDITAHCVDADHSRPRSTPAATRSSRSLFVGTFGNARAANHRSLMKKLCDRRLGRRLGRDTELLRVDALE